MPGIGDWEQIEYDAIMARGRDAERSSLLCWTASGIASAVLLSWGIAARNSSLMLPVVFAAAYGFYAAIHSRQQIRLIAGYVREYIESRGSGPQWFTRLGHLEVVPGFNPSGDWVATTLANAFVVTAIVFSWLYASASPRGDLMAGVTTGLGLIFCFHSVTETGRLRQTDAAALWRRIASGPTVESRGPKLASR